MYSEDSGEQMSIDDLSSSSKTTLCFRRTLQNFELLLGSASFEEKSQMLEILQGLLSVDVISLLYQEGCLPAIRLICEYLDVSSILNMQLVSRSWNKAVADSNVWRSIIFQMVETEPLWRELGIKRKWLEFIQNEPCDSSISQDFFRTLYCNIIHDIKTLKNNWENGRCSQEVIMCGSIVTNGAYTIQYDDEKIVAGLRDHSIKAWNLRTKELIDEYWGHNGSVLCLQYEDNHIISGSSDHTVRIWEMNPKRCIKVIEEHSSAVLCLKFSGERLITCSKDWSLNIFDISTLTNPLLLKTLSVHRGAINAVDFDDQYILSASGDRSLIMWCAKELIPLYTFNGHNRGIASLHYDYPLAATGSSDNTIRLWNVEERSCINVINGNRELVRCIRFDEHHLVSGAYDGRILVWSMKTLQQSFDPTFKYPHYFLHKHTGRVFKVIFDRFKIISSSHDDTIIIWNFLEQKYNSELFWTSPNIQSIHAIPFLLDCPINPLIEGDGFDE